MTEYTLEQLNEAAKTDPAMLIARSEQRYLAQVDAAAEKVAENAKQKPIVLVNGPSSAGKTTTSDRLCRALKKRGLSAKMLSMDDYYRTLGSYEVPRDDENNVPDLESPTCMDLNLLGQHLKKLAAGEQIMVPRHDFQTHTFHPDDHPFQLGTDEVAIIEGIHAFNPVLMGELSPMSSCVALSVGSRLKIDDVTTAEPDMLRFLRRAERDSLFRGTTLEETLTQWPSVRRGERLYIQPHLHVADAHINTFLPYEVNVLMTALDLRLRNNIARLKELALEPILKLIGNVVPIDFEGYIPSASLLHEFIG